VIEILDLQSIELSNDEFRDFELHFHLKVFNFNGNFLFKNIGNPELALEDLELIEK